jgi:hypothetical protein
MGLSCLNCGKAITQQDGKLFAECLVCSDCNIIAERVYQQAQCELSQLLVTLKELIRLAIVKHQLSFVPATEDAGDGQLRQKRTLELILEMMRNQENPTCPTHQPRSTKSLERPSTKSSAATPGADGPPSSSSSPEPSSSQETPSTETQATEPSDNA